MIYFNECQNLEEVKATFKNLAKKFHPDLSGFDSTSIMQEINKEYKFAIAQAAKFGFKKDGQKFTDQEVNDEILNAEQYQAAINAIIHLEGIDIELCGGWLWVSGNTFQHKGIFKANGFYFASKKIMWYFRSVQYATSNFKPMEIGQIRAKYGSQQISHKAAHYNYLAQ